MTASEIKAIVLFSGELDEASLLFLDTLKVRETATYLTTDVSQAEEIRKHARQADIVDAQTYIERDGSSHELVFIPGHGSAVRIDDAAWTTVIQSLYHEDIDVVAVGTGRLLLAASGLLKESTASSASLDLKDDYISLAAGWRSEEIIRHRFLWTANDSAATLRSLAYLYRAARKDDMPSEFPPHAFEDHQPEAPSTSISAAPSEDLARMIAEHSSSDVKDCIEPIAMFAVRLALEGHVAACNAVITSLLTLFPNMYDDLGESTIMPLECVWRSLDDRPATPWEVTPEQIDTWDADAREGYKIPDEEEDRLDTLESLKLRVTLGRDQLLYPYTTPGAIVMALEAGWVEEARQWMTMLVQAAMLQDALWAYHVGGCRALVDFALTGVVAEITSRTTLQAEHDAATIRRALLAFKDTSVTVEHAKRATAQQFTDASWPALVRTLDVLKLEDFETLLRPPASPSAIREAEERLGMDLPSDYKDFLLVSNGLEDLSINAPGLKRVEELCWENPDELGLEWLRVDLGCKVDPAEEEQLPSMKRVLVISESGEEMLWFVEPDTVLEAIQVLKGLGRSDEAVGNPGWRPALFVHWIPETTWFKTFRGYIQHLAQEAEKSGAQLTA